VAASSESVSPQSEFLLTQFLKHPIVGLVIGIAISIALYFLSLNEMQPSYAVSEPVAIATKQTGVDELRILYKEVEVQAAYRKRIVLWNAGRKAIEKSSISTDQPICVRLGSDMLLLSQRVSQTSRPNLLVLTRTLTDDQGMCIALEIQGDEAFEVNDGVVIDLFYASPNDPSITVSGRIKGVKEGFAQLNWDTAIRRKMKPMNWFSLVFLAINTLVGARMLWIEIKRYRAGEKNNLYLGLICFVPLTTLAVYMAKPVFFGLNWVE
jgi:hypothetical protein